jgi:hypothetical protein
MCFILISGKIEIVSCYDSNRLVYITEMECVYCAVRAESVIQFSLIFLFKRKEDLGVCFEGRC